LENNKGIQVTALHSESNPINTSPSHPPQLMPQPLCIDNEWYILKNPLGESLMQNPQKQIKEYLDKLIFRFLYIHSLHRQINQISEWMIPARIQAINVGAHFFNLTLYSFGRTVLLELFKLVSDNEDKSLIDFLTKAKENANSLQLSDDQDGNDADVTKLSLDPDHYRSVVDSHLAQIQKHSDVIDTLKGRRDKEIAHTDKTYFNDPRKLLEHFPLRDIDITSLMDTISEVLRQQYSLLLQADMIMRISSLSDVEDVLNYVRAFSHVKKDKRLTHDYKIPVYKYLQDDYEDPEN
jgi:hypothetical protein